MSYFQSMWSQIRIYFIVVRETSVRDGSQSRPVLESVTMQGLFWICGLLIPAGSSGNKVTMPRWSIKTMEMRKPFPVTKILASLQVGTMIQ